MQKIKLRWIVVLLSITFINMNYGQSKSNNFIKIAFSNTNYLPLEIRSQGIKLLESQISPSAEIGLSYTRNFANNWGIDLGANYSLISFNLFYNFYAKSDVFPIGAFINDHHRLTIFDFFQARMTSNLSIHKTIAVNKNTFVRATLGANFDITKNIEVWTLTETAVNPKTFEEFHFFNAEMTHYSSIGFYGSGILKLGIGRNLKNNNFYLINLVGCYAPSAILNGNFEFHNIEYESKGTLKFRPSYFGIEFNYAFALKKKNQ